MRFWTSCLCGTLLYCAMGTFAAEDQPLRLGIVGLSHDHVNGFLNRDAAGGDAEIVGIVEKDKSLRDKYSQRFQLEPGLFYIDLDTMLNDAKPEAVAIFTSTYDHTSIVEVCAKRGIHTMMEKPLAVSMEHARRIEKAGQTGNIHVLVNYETTWYPSNHRVYREIHQIASIGPIRKMVVHDGHKGPREIGCSEEFLAWLTHPELNGGGALFDFGCYGANLMTWLMDNRRPYSVTAITQQIKPDVYPNVDDEATIILEYPDAQGIIQASWNWPYNRKDMEIYGKTGYAHAPNRGEVKIKIEEQKEETVTPEPLEEPNDRPLAYLKAVVRGKLKPEGLSSLENNLIVTEILDAARRSAIAGQKIVLKK